MNGRDCLRDWLGEAVLHQGDRLDHDQICIGRP